MSKKRKHYTFKTTIIKDESKLEDEKAVDQALKLYIDKIMEIATKKKDESD
ncbi:hypothetical protein SAMN04487944_101205 [Gracilibacillus ureilyticus]|uniref:Uncharacterized protein n=1 Tax=Gracilibacillus ureilyticus TaxID=531814 RepID=A0A1H9LD56_9BACI|nr:hypothetical protein [Gracilibacillus ureilyticus]SER09344.1 hypothetical protein SAMN04487944_101205 [Gracilibacillus ureilyticus]